MMNESKVDYATIPTPTLTLDPFEVVETEPVQNQIRKTTTPEIVLTPEEQQMVDQFAAQINLNDTNMVMQYGAGAQQKIADFSDRTLQSVRTQDLGEVGELLTKMVTELKSFDTDKEEGLFSKMFHKGQNKIETMKAKYAAAEINVNKIVDALETHQVTLLKDIQMLDQMYQTNLAYFKELSMYILAGKKKIEEAKTVELPQLIGKSQASGLPEDAQDANDFANKIDRFEKKLHDLDLTRTVAMQMAPQIRLLQNNDALMDEKIQSSLVNTIPLWKSQMVLALGVAHATQAAKAQNEVTEMTNALLKKNADTLKLNTIETAKASERGIVDIETLKHTNESLITTFDEVLRIQQEGREKRLQAEQELRDIEAALKEKLLEVSQTKRS